MGFHNFHKRGIVMSNQKIFGKGRKQNHYRSRLILICEGKRTEVEYFNQIKARYNDTVFLLVPRKSDNHEIDALISEAKNEKIHVEWGDKICIVLDRDEDNHKEEQLARLHQWEQETGRMVALTNPRFEYWLLLHFEDKPTKRNALDKFYLEKYIANYSQHKSVARSTNLFERDRLIKAAERANLRPHPTPEAPDQLGTGVGKIIQLLFS